MDKIDGQGVFIRVETMQ